MTALVTGCAGFIGSHLTESLLASGSRVIGIDCFNDNYQRPFKLRNLERALAHPNFDFVPIDMSRGDLEDLVEEAEVVFHLAAEPGVRNSWGRRFETYVRNNILATQQLLEAMRRTDPRPLVFASSSSVYGDTENLPTSEDDNPRPHSPYGVTKLSAEQLCLLYHRNFGLPCVALRFFTVYGPRQRPDMAFTRFFSAALRNEPITVLGDGRQGRDFTYVDDVVAALLCASKNAAAAGTVLNVGAGSPTELRDVVTIMGRVIERPLEITYEPRQSGDVRRTAADLTAIRRTLNWEPTTTLEIGLEAQFAWIKGLDHSQLTAALPSDA
jgi:UDP-glucuronate 4-epimerase